LQGRRHRFTVQQFHPAEPDGRVPLRLVAPQGPGTFMPLFDDPPLHDFPDRAIRYLLETPANLRELLLEVVPGIAPFLDYDHVERQDRSFLMEDWRNRESDLLFRIPFRSPGGETSVLVCILLEHQSAPDPRMPLRVLIYAVLYWEREWKAREDRHDPGQPLRLTPILPIVFHTGAQPWNTNRSLAERAEFETVLAQVLPRLVELRRHEEIRGHDLLWFVLSWALRRGPQEDREQLRTFLQTTIADAAMREEVLAVSNTVGETWEQREERRVAQTAAASALRAELQTRREALRDLLEEHFGAVPEDVLRRIEACEDPARLRAAHRQALHVQWPGELQLQSSEVRRGGVAEDAASVLLHRPGTGGGRPSLHRLAGWSSAFRRSGAKSV
jgi:hypothetical protein